MSYEIGYDKVTFRRWFQRVTIMLFTEILLMAVALLTGLTLAFVVKNYIKRDIGDVVVAALVVIPIILLWAGGGRLTEISGFGITAKFQQIAKKPISAIATKLTDLTIFSLTPNDPNFALAAYFEACADYFVVRPSKVPTDDTELSKYIVNVTWAVRSSLSCGQLQGVVVLDDNDRYLGAFAGGFFAESLAVWAVPTSRDPVPIPDLASRIMTFTAFGAALHHPKERIERGDGFKFALNDGDSLRTALGKFRTTKALFLPLLDSENKFKGIVTYRAVVDALLNDFLAE